jgi:ubiquinone/menaquinone biosynthesis C-methylase UbiE
VARWPRPDELQSILERSGLRDVSYDLVFGGVAAVHTGLKA